MSDSNRTTALFQAVQFHDRPDQKHDPVAVVETALKFEAFLDGKAKPKSKSTKA